MIRLQPQPAADTPDDVIEFATRDEELWAAAQWAKKQIESGLERIGIVLLDMTTDRQPLEYHLRDAFGCLDARYNDLPVNFSTGIPLASTPVTATCCWRWSGKFDLSRHTSGCPYCDRRISKRFLEATTDCA